MKIPKAINQDIPKDERRLGISSTRTKGRWTFRLDLWTKSWTWRVIPRVGSRFIYIIRRDREYSKLPYAFEVISGHDALAQPDFSFKTAPHALLQYFAHSYGGNALVVVATNGIEMRAALKLKQSRIEEYLDYRTNAVPVIHLEKADGKDILAINDFLIENDLHMLQLCDVPSQDTPVVYTDKLEIHNAA